MRAPGSRPGASTSSTSATALSRPKVREILGAGGGAPFVTLAGIRPQTETPRTLAASDILLSPHVPNPDGTPFFGSPTKLFEYMAMAKPIVASDLDQVGWVLKGWRPGETPPAAGAAGRASAAVLVDARQRGLARGRDPPRRRPAGRRARSARRRGAPPRARVLHLGPQRGGRARTPASRAVRRDLARAAALSLVVACLWCFVSGLTSREAWRVPIDYHGDSWMTLAFLKAAADRHITLVGALDVPELGAPHGAGWNGFLRQHKLQYVLVAPLARAIGLFPTANLLPLAAAVLAALSFYGVSRYFRTRPEWALAGATAFALSPYLFYRSLSHLTLTFYWPLPLAILVVSWAFGRSDLRLRSARFAAAMAIVVVTGLHNIYYAGLLAQFLALAALARARHEAAPGHRRWPRSRCCCCSWAPCSWTTPTSSSRPRAALRPTVWLGR